MAERTDKDYAIEHAGYLAQAARRMIAAADALATADLHREESDSDSSHEAVDEAREGIGEARRALTSAIYEFEKRRDRAAAPSRSQAGQASTDKPDSGDLAVPTNEHSSVGGWRPIATRPVDGTRYLAADSMGLVRLVRQADPYDRLPIGDDGDRTVWPTLPTHWQPLPEAPALNSTEPKLCNYCGIVIDSGAACITDAEFDHCPARTLFDSGALNSTDGVQEVPRG